MTRVLIEELLFFLLPFALFAIWLLIRRKSPLKRAHWDGQVSWIVLAGLVLTLATLLVTAFIAPRGGGAYVPAHMENGQFVPGRIE
jgi:hypothetical protein